MAAQERRSATSHAAGRKVHPNPLNDYVILARLQMRDVCDFEADVVERLQIEIEVINRPEIALVRQGEIRVGAGELE